MFSDRNFAGETWALGGRRHCVRAAVLGRHRQIATREPKLPSVPGSRLRPRRPFLNLDSQRTDACPPSRLRCGTENVTGVTLRVASAAATPIAHARLQQAFAYTRRLGPAGGSPG